MVLVSGLLTYGALKKLAGIRLDPEQEFAGADLPVHRLSSTPERATNWWAHQA